MRTSLVTIAAAIALSALAGVAARAATMRDPAQDQSENQVTAQLNEAQVQGSGGWGVITYEGIMQRPNQAPMMQEQIAQPPQDSDNLSIIE